MRARGALWASAPPLNSDVRPHFLMARRRYVVWGILVAVSVPLIALIVSTVWLALSYDGRCGGMMSWLAAAKPCARAEYVAGTLSLLTLIVLTEYWPFVLAWFGVPVAIGYLLDRSAGHRAV